MELTITNILGFSDLHRWKLVEPDDTSVFHRLESLNKPFVGFSLWPLEGHGVFALVTIPMDHTKMTANLKAPLFINYAAATASQEILEKVPSRAIQTPIWDEVAGIDSVKEDLLYGQF